jgi:hypothetical protein
VLSRTWARECRPSFGSGLGRDSVGVATERQAALADIEFEVLGHLVPVDDGTDLEGNLGRATQRPAGASVGRTENAIEPDVTQCAEHSGDMAVRRRAAR